MNEKRTKPLNLILEARERRTAMKITFAKSGFNSLTLSLNIPGFPKSNELLSSFFSSVKRALKTFLKANRISLLEEKENVFTDEAGDFYIVAISNNEKSSLIKLKELTEKFEEKHPLGRLIDVDLFSAEGIPISSGKQKSCFYCKEQPAVYCMKTKNHTYKEIREKISLEVAGFLKTERENDFVTNIVSYAVRALLYEVSLSPKPGLVAYTSQGIHTDMNYYTFLNSSAVLASFFQEFATAGLSFSSNWNEVLPIIREIGLRAEEAMFKVTDNANTQKGIIFIFGISLFSYAYLYTNKKDLSDTSFQTVVRKINQAIVKNELRRGLSDDSTHGEEVFIKYAKAGIRQEVAGGFQTIFQEAVPFLKNNFKPILYKNQKEMNAVLQKTLLKIMAQNEDTNIIYRSNLQVLQELQSLAHQAIDSSVAYEALCDFCESNKISPGGSADLLALSLLVHFVNINY